LQWVLQRIFFFRFLQKTIPFIQEFSCYINPLKFFAQPSAGPVAAAFLQYVLDESSTSYELPISFPVVSLTFFQLICCLFKIKASKL